VKMMAFKNVCVCVCGRAETELAISAREVSS